MVGGASANATIADDCFRNFRLAGEGLESISFLFISIKFRIIFDKAYSERNQQDEFYHLKSNVNKMRVRGGGETFADDRLSSRVQHRKQPDGLQNEQQHNDAEKDEREVFLRFDEEKRNQQNGCQRDFDLIQPEENEFSDTESERERNVRRAKFKRRFQEGNAADNPKPDERDGNL